MKQVSKEKLTQNFACNWSSFYYVMLSYIVLFLIWNIFTSGIVHAAILIKRGENREKCTHENI